MEMITSDNVLNRMTARSKELKVTIKHAVRKVLMLIKKRRKHE